jgi:hypothetical protein
MLRCSHSPAPSHSHPSNRDSRTYWFCAGPPSREFLPPDKWPGPSEFEGATVLHRAYTRKFVKKWNPSEWEPNTVWSAVSALSTLLAVGVGGCAVVFANQAADDQKELSERLVAIEEQRDQPRIQVLANLYVTVETPDAPPGRFEPGPLQALITVTNVGSVLGGPVSVSVTTANGTDVSVLDADPQFVQPEEMVTFAVNLDAKRALVGDMDRAAHSDFPKGFAQSQRAWLAAKLRSGYFIRAWDGMTGRNWWYPRQPPKEPAEPPPIS